MIPKPDQLKATVVSLFPMAVPEHKPGLYPGYFVIPAAPLGDITFLVVGDAVFYQETKNEQMLSIRTPFHVLAESIVYDFLTSHIGRIVGEAEPGMFWIPGGYYDKETIKEVAAEEIAEADRKQLAWFAELVKIADDTYSRTRRHTSVSTLQRLAATRLGLQRPWTIEMTSMHQCKFCKAQVQQDAVKCPNCREILDKEAYAILLNENPEAVQDLNT